MENRDNQSPETGRQADYDKSKQPPEAAEQGKGSDWKNEQSDPLARDGEGQASSGQASGNQAYESGAERSETLTEQRSDIEGSSLGKDSEKGDADGFIGTQGSSDTSSELIEDDENIPSDGE